MTNPTLSIFSGAESFGTVFREQNQIVINYLDGSVPTSDTTGRKSLRNSATRFIAVQGASDGTGFSGSSNEEKTNSFIQKMESWFNVNTTVYAAANYTDSYGNTYKVDCVDFTWNRSTQQPFRILYNLLLVERGDVV